MTPIEALRMALEELEQATSFSSRKARDRYDKTVQALRAAIADNEPASQQQEPQEPKQEINSKSRLKRLAAQKP